ncbi:hypothetical protein VTH06DRAFT_4698 [Thermothelomyces fergusii]
MPKPDFVRRLCSKFRTEARANPKTNFLWAPPAAWVFGPLTLPRGRPRLYRLLPDAFRRAPSKLAPQQQLQQLLPNDSGFVLPNLEAVQGDAHDDDGTRREEIRQEEAGGLAD